MARPRPLQFGLNFDYNFLCEIGVLFVHAQESGEKDRVTEGRKRGRTNRVTPVDYDQVEPTHEV